MSWFKPDKTATELVEKAIAADPLKFTVGQVVRMTRTKGAPVPVAGALDKLSVKAVEFRVPTKADYWVGRTGTIFGPSESEIEGLNLSDMAGHRIILGRK